MRPGDLIKVNPKNKEAKFLIKQLLRDEFKKKNQSKNKCKIKINSK
jgi:hypothetical protein